MKKVVGFVFTCLGIVLAFAAATPVHAQNYHSFVSGNGTGTACTFSAPCALLDTAVSATISGGLVSCVDQGANSEGSSSFGLAILTKSLTIDCAGTSAGVYSVIINGPGIVVTLRNLNINGLTLQGSYGVDFLNGSALFVEHCVIENWTVPGAAIGIRFAPPNGVTAELHVTDSVIKNNGNGTSGGGIIIQPSGSGAVHAVIERTTVENNTYGIFANNTGGTGSILLHIKDSTVANSTVNGISAYTAGSTTAIVIDHSSSLINGGSGILSQGSGGLVFLTDTTVMSHGTEGLRDSASVVSPIGFTTGTTARSPSPRRSPSTVALATWETSLVPVPTASRSAPPLQPPSFSAILPWTVLPATVS